VTGLALAFAHPWLALGIAVAGTTLLAAGTWWLWRWVRARLRPRA